MQGFQLFDLGNVANACEGEFTQPRAIFFTIPVYCPRIFLGDRESFNVLIILKSAFRFMSFKACVCALKVNVLDDARRGAVKRSRNQFALLK